MTTHNYVFMHLLTHTQLWDVGAQKLVRRMRSHNSRVSSLAWNPQNNLLSTGSQSGAIHIYNAKQAQFHMTTLEANTMDVCGLSWSPNGRFLASGGNDNMVCIWDTYSQDPWSFPAHTLKEHNAAIKVYIIYTLLSILQSEHNNDMYIHNI